MPAPTQNELALLAKMLFLSKRKSIPEDWRDPGDQFPLAFRPSELMAMPNSPLNLFREATLYKIHVSAARDIGKLYNDFIDGICGAICDAIDKWMKMAFFSSALINGPVGLVMPGSLAGPLLTPFILAKGPRETAMLTKYTNAVANALGTGWLGWQSGLMGMLAYPAFAAFPGPMAPPTPNVPVPLITFLSPGEVQLSPDRLKSTLCDFLAEPGAQHAEDLFDALAKAFFIIFQKFKVSTLVQNVQGMGPIPTFAPPVVPAGPVLGGTVIPTPGVLQ